MAAAHSGSDRVLPIKQGQYSDGIRSTRSSTSSAR